MLTLPGNYGDVLRERHPGKYETVVHPVPDPNGWFRATITIDFRLVKVYVNGLYSTVVNR